MAAAVGKQVAGREGFRPSWSPAPACLRTPWGPSDRVILRTPSRSTLRVCQKSLPERRKHFSSNVIF